MAVRGLQERHRDRWIGWPAELQFQRLHLIADNTRFVILGAKGAFPRPGSFTMAVVLRRLGDTRGFARRSRRPLRPSRRA